MLLFLEWRCCALGDVRYLVYLVVFDAAVLLAFQPYLLWCSAVITALPHFVLMFGIGDAALSEVVDAGFFGALIRPLQSMVHGL